jgi:hypothetical protein
MGFVAFILAIIAAVIFLLGPATVNRWGRTWTNVSLGLFFLTVAWICQLVITSHPVHN